ncbi:MAG: DUF4340 domain-containing protein [Terriglobia bacterium]
MKKKYLNTAIAIVVFGVLIGSMLWYNKRQSHEPSTTTSKPEEKVFPVETKTIASFTLTSKDGKKFTCRRDGSAWSIVDPQKLGVDQSAVDGFLSSLTSATVDEVVDPHPANLKDFGLDSPATTIDVSTSGKPTQFTLLLGDDTPTSSGLYAQVGGNPRVITLPDYLKTSLEKSMFDLRDKRVVTLDPDQLQKIEVESKGKSWTIVKNPEGVWDLMLPPAVRADRFAVDDLVNQLRSTTMQAIAAESKKEASKYGFGSPELRIKLTGPNGTQTLTLGKKDGDNYDATNSSLDPIFTVGSRLDTSFKKDPADLRAKDLFSFVSSDAKHLEVTTPKGHWVFDQQNNKWKQTSPAAKDEPSEKVESVLNDLLDLRASSFPKASPGDLAAFGLAKAGNTFQVRYGEKNQTETVEAAKVGDHVYARRPTDPLPAELPKNALDAIEKDLGAL